MQRILKHPLFLLILGTLLGSVLIPFITSQAAHAREVEEVRSQRALSALQENYQVEERLNVLLTTFGTFWSETDDTNREARRPELRTKIYSVYEEFDRTGWWWFDEAWQTARILSLLSPSETQEAQKLSDDYRASLRTFTEAMDPVWKMSLAQTPPPSAAEAEAALARARTVLNDSRTKRLQIVGTFSHMLSRRNWLRSS